MQRKQRPLRSGFTMIELVAVLIIVGLLSTVAMTTFVPKIKKARVTTTKANLKMLHGAVTDYYYDVGEYPTEEQGLEALVTEPTGVTGWSSEGYLQTTSVPNDAWGNPFVYRSPADNGKAFVVISYGADGEEGGEELNADLYSTDAE